VARSSKKQVKKAEWKGYHKVNLNKADEALFETWAKDNHVQLTDFEPLALNGYKISFSWDDYHEGVSASLYCTAQKMDWAGYSLTAWAGDIETAVKLLFFKHFIMCREQWEIAPDRPDKGTSPYG